MRVLADLEVQLAEDDLVELLEDAILGCALVLLVLSLDNFVHSVQVLLQPDFVYDEVRVSFLIKLLIFPWHVHILDFIVQEETGGRLLEADHVLRERFAGHSVEVLGQVVGRVADVEYRSLAEESEIHGHVRMYTILKEWF